MNIDIAQKLNDALPTFASLIVGLAYVILVMVFRSLLIPLKAKKVINFVITDIVVCYQANDNSSPKSCSNTHKSTYFITVSPFLLSLSHYY